jgi:hypothetical protein
MVMEVVLAMVVKVAHVALHPCGPLSMVFEHFQNSFDFEDSTNDIFRIVCS